MAQNHRVLYNVLPNLTMLPVVNVTSTDAGEVNLEKDIVRIFELRYRPVFVDNALGS